MNVHVCLVTIAEILLLQTHSKQTNKDCNIQSQLIQGNSNYTCNNDFHHIPDKHRKHHGSPAGFNLPGCAVVQSIHAPL